MMDVGLYRIAPGSEIRKSSYNYELNQIGPYKFIAPIPYLKKYHIEHAEPSRYYLYEAILGNPNALAAFFTSNTYVAIVYPHKITYVGCYNNELIEYKFETKLEVPKLEHIGYVKTYCECKTIATLPYKLMYNKETQLAYLRDVWVPLQGNPVLNPPLSLYKELLEHEGTEACFILQQDNKIIYLR